MLLRLGQMELGERLLDEKTTLPIERDTAWTLQMRTVLTKAKNEG